MSFLNPWVALGLAIALAASAAGGYKFGYDSAELWWDAKWSKDLLDRAEAKGIAEKEARAAEQAATAAQAAERKRYEARILVSDTALAAALVELRDADRLRDRAPAASAPAECSGYDADPAMLSGDDAEILFRLAARADRVVEQLASAQQHIAILRDATGQVD